LNHGGVVAVKGQLVVNYPFSMLDANVVLYVVLQVAVEGAPLVLVDLNTTGEALITVDQLYLQYKYGL
jgi:hypothetical protein